MGDVAAGDSGRDAAPRGEPDERALVDVARELFRELRPGARAAVPIGPRSHLERDLGLDSLARVELVARVERAFGVALPSELAFEAERLTDLLAAARGAPRTRTAPAVERAEPSGVALRAPITAEETLVSALAAHARHAPDRTHLVLASAEGSQRSVTFGALDERARRAAAGLRALGVEADDRVALMLPTCEGFFVAFFSVLYAGGVPVPIYPPFRRAQLEEHLRRQTRILVNAGTSMMVSTPEIGASAALLSAQVPTSKAVRSLEQLEVLGGRGGLAPVQRDPDDLALLQYTSGSTGDPKGVALSHANLIANIRAMVAAAHASAGDVMVSWLPLYHDMGLIGMWLTSLYLGARAVILSPLDFLSRPERWLWAIHRHRGTVSAAPNFAFDLCSRRIRDEDLRDLDLSSLRLLGNGSEPVRPPTLRRFTERFAPFGLRPEALVPLYGLAECSVDATFPPLGRAPLVEGIDRELLAREGRAEPSSTNVIEVVSCGPALPGHAVRVVDPSGAPLPERREGEIEVRGPSCTRGYFRDEARSQALYDGEWLRTGDLGYVAASELYVTGRIKDVVIRAGRHVHPQEIEDAVAELPGVRKGCVAAFGAADPTRGTERFVVVAETRETNAGARDEMRRRVQEVVTSVVGEPADEVVLAPPHAVLKTSSGKLRRGETRALYERGELERRAQPLRGQVLRLLASGARVRARRWGARAIELTYGAYFWVVLVTVGLVAWVLVAVAPRIEHRWRVFHTTARVLFRLWGCELRLHGALPRDQPWVYVLNHESYTDGLVLAAVLPGEPVLVVMREAERQFVSRVFLRRLGATFVERAEPRRGVEDSDAAAMLAEGGGPSCTSRRGG
ncbi:MAG: AMP-binding protein [Sandaracinaceae bacterium]|nr:AMP-binding protein [Sandaracinaceae bacterium]